MNYDNLPTEEAPFTRAQTEERWPDRHLALEAWSSEDRYLKILCPGEPHYMNYRPPDPEWDNYSPELCEIFGGEAWVPSLDQRLRAWLAKLVNWEFEVEPLRGYADRPESDLFDFNAHHREGIEIARDLKAELGPDWTVEVHGSWRSGLERELLWTSRHPEMPLRRSRSKWQSIPTPEPDAKRPLRGIGLAALVGLLTYALFFAVQTLRPRQLASSLPDGLLPGDVVLMRSHTWRAELVRVIDGVPYRDGWSHVGLLHARLPDGTWEVVHAVPGADGMVRREAWPSIVGGGGISAAAVFRHEGLSEDTRAELVVLQADAARRAVPFDPEFDHNDASALYCTELVTALYREAGVEAVGPEVMRKRAVFPGHIAGAPGFGLVGTTSAAPR